MTKEQIILGEEIKFGDKVGKLLSVESGLASVRIGGKKIIVPLENISYTEKILNRLFTNKKVKDTKKETSARSKLILIAHQRELANNWKIDNKQFFFAVDKILKLK